jgi:hypothetical protein
MVRIRLILPLLALGAALAGCATPAQVTQREDVLADSGFMVVPATTPDRQAQLAMLPHHRFVHQTRDGNPVVIYADPSVCDCLYIGSPAAFDKYRATMKARNIEIAEEKSANIAKMDWGAWPAMGP